MQLNSLSLERFKRLHSGVGYSRRPSDHLEWSTAQISSIQETAGDEGRDRLGDQAERRVPAYVYSNSELERIFLILNVFLIFLIYRKQFSEKYEKKR